MHGEGESVTTTSLCDLTNHRVISTLLIKLRRYTADTRQQCQVKQYIPYHSHCHPRIIAGVMRCMRDRAHSICHPTKKQQEMDYLNQVFQANGFPETLVKKAVAVGPLPPHGPSESQQQDNAPKILYTLYVRGLSEKIEKVCAQLGVKPVFSPMKTLITESLKVKTRSPKQKHTEVRYKIPCKERSEVYVGETKRTLKVRLSEHRIAVKRGDPKNGIAVHV